MQTRDDHDPRFDYHKHFAEILERDRQVVIGKDHEYGASWKKRGGTGAYMMLARKWDRIEEQVEGYSHFNVFSALEHDTRPEGLLDDIRDLRRYLLLVEAEYVNTMAKNDSNKHAFSDENK